MTNKDELQQAQRQLSDMKNDLDALQQVLKNSNNEQAELLIQQMTGKNGMLRTLGSMLNQLLQDPVVRQAVESSGPLKTNKTN